MLTRYRHSKLINHPVVCKKDADKTITYEEERDANDEEEGEEEEGEREDEGERGDEGDEGEEGEEGEEGDVAQMFIMRRHMQ